MHIYFWRYSQSMSRKDGWPAFLAMLISNTILSLEFNSFRIYLFSYEIYIGIDQRLSILFFSSDTTCPSDRDGPRLRTPRPSIAALHSFDDSRRYLISQSILECHSTLICSRPYGSQTRLLPVSMSMYM